MEAVGIPADNVPSELKVCEQILKRAKELKKAEPVVAYWCWSDLFLAIPWLKSLPGCFSAAQKALSVSGRSNEGTMWLMSLLDALEQMKALLSGNEAVLSEAAGAAYIENFALKVFMSADNDDRNGIHGKGTIRKFVVAGQFIEVLRCFENGMTEEMEQKLQYARWKAADGAKALRERRKPQSGPPLNEPEFDLPQIPTGSPGSKPKDSPSPPPVNRTRSNGSPGQVTPIVSPRPSPLSAPKLIDAHLDDISAPRHTNSSASGAWSTVATPGLPDSGEEPRFDLDAPRPAPSAPPLDAHSRSPSGERKNVRFMGPDGAPLSPATTHFTVDSYDAPNAPPPTTFAPSPTSPTAPTTRSRVDSSSISGPNPSSAQAPSTISVSRARGDSLTKASPTSTSAQPPPAPPPSLVTQPSAPSAPSAPPTRSAPQPQTQSHARPQTSALGLGLASPYPPILPAKTSLTRKETEQTQKHAKWAISALDYDDLETARNELKKALEILGG